METRAHHVLIGLFTVAVAAAALAFGLWLSKSHRDREIHYYSIVFNEAVNGLTRGSSVLYSGITIGDVVRLTLDPKDPRRVLARVRIEGDVPIKQDTRARLALTGITGTSVIQLSNGSPESPRLESTDGEDPIIVAVPSPINQFLTSGEDLLISVNELLASAQTLLSEENGRRVSHILENIDKASNTMTAQGDSLRELVEQMTLASRQATASLAQAGTLVNNANTLVTQDGARTLGSAEKAMQSLERTGATLEHLLTQNRDALTGGAQGLAELGPAIAELRTTLASLRGISRRLEDNPANYLLGRENIREFQP